MRHVGKVGIVSKSLPLGILPSAGFLRKDAFLLAFTGRIRLRAILKGYEVKQTQLFPEVKFIYIPESDSRVSAYLGG